MLVVAAVNLSPPSGSARLLKCDLRVLLRRYHDVCRLHSLYRIFQCSITSWRWTARSKPGVK